MKKIEMKIKKMNEIKKENSKRRGEGNVYKKIFNTKMSVKEG